MRLHVPVEVRNHYDGRWDEGFEVVAERPSGLRLRRLSDGAVLPVEFPADEVRPVDE
jgi:hypothetical protein